MPRDDLSKRKFRKDTIGPVITPLFAEPNSRIEVPSSIRSDVVPEQPKTLPGVHPSALDGLSPGSIGSNGKLSGFSPNGQFTPVLSARGNDTHPEILTLCLSASGPNGAPDYAVKALVRWGVGGASHSAIVDVLRGTQVTIVATAVDVGFSQTAQVQAQPNPATETLVSVSLCSGARSSHAPRYSETEAIAPAGRMTRPVPSFASKVRAFGGASLVGCAVSFTTSNAVQVASFTIASDAQAAEGFDIPGNATYCVIQNNTGGVIDTTMCFDLNL